MAEIDSMKMTASGTYLAPDLKVVVLGLMETFLQESNTAGIETSGEEDEIDW